MTQHRIAVILFNANALHGHRQLTLVMAQKERAILLEEPLADSIAD